MSAATLVMKDYRLTPTQAPPTVVETLDAAEKATLVDRIRRLLKERDATLVAHYYTSPELQELADATGGYVSDSLDMARFGTECPSSTLIVAGVRFMGETAKVLNPGKTVLVPSNKAGCSLASGIKASDVRALKLKYPGAPVVSYVNTYADVKAESDYCCTSGNAAGVVRQFGVG